MKLSLSAIAILSSTTNVAAFAAFAPSTSFTKSIKSIALKGYLDNLSSDLYAEDATPDVEKDLRENNAMSKDQLDQYGPGNLNDYVDFEEFDGGDGQMGVAGDGQKGLDKSEFSVQEIGAKIDRKMGKSQMRSARNAWGSSTGYADKLIAEKGMDTARAQQLENWANQQEIQTKKRQQQAIAESYETERPEEDWRSLAKFGVERVTESNLEDEFGAVTTTNAENAGIIELSSAPNSVSIHQFEMKNPFMGFADFRAALTGGSDKAWSVEPTEGALQKSPTEFTVKFRPEMLGMFEGELVIETEDFKKVWKLIGSTG